MSKYDINCKSPMVVEYPSLRWPETTTPRPESDLDVDGLDLLLRYVILMCSKRQVRSLEKRKEECIKQLKIKNAAVKREIEGNGEDYAAVLLRYLKISRSYVFEEWYSLKTAWHNWNAYLRVMPDDEKVIEKQLAITKQISSVKKQLIEVENSLFDDEETADLMAATQEKAMLTGYAEKYALEFKI